MVGHKRLCIFACEINKYCICTNNYSSLTLTVVAGYRYKIKIIINCLIVASCRVISCFF